MKSDQEQRWRNWEREFNLDFNSSTTRPMSSAETLVSLNPLFSDSAAEHVGLSLADSLHPGQWRRRVTCCYL